MVGSINAIIKGIVTVVADLFKRFFIAWLVCAGVAFFFLMLAGFAGLGLWFLSVIAGTVVWLVVLVIYEAGKVGPV